MSDRATAPAPAAPKKSAAKGKSTTATKKPPAEPSQPKTADMVRAAIKNLKERRGSSLYAIKKYIAGYYKVDAEKWTKYIKRYLKTAVASGSLIQSKGKGLKGSFKLGPKGGKPSAAKKPVKASKPAAPKAKKTKSTTGNKPAPAIKKSASIVPMKAPAKPKTAKPASGGSKAKKTTKSPTRKPRAPKPKKVSAAKSPKKAATKKK